MVDQKSNSYNAVWIIINSMTKNFFYKASNTIIDDLSLAEAIIN